jgi:hypothetical protein
MCCRMVLNSVQGLRPATQGIDMRERPGPVSPPKFGPMQGSPGSAEADERVEGLVDEMQRWAQSGELKVEEGQEEWKRAHDARQGRPAAAIPQSTPRRQNTSPSNTGEPPQGLFMPDRSRLSSPSMTSQHGQFSQGRARSSTPGRASDGGAVATPPPNPSPVTGAIKGDCGRVTRVDLRHFHYSYNSNSEISDGVVEQR